MSYNAPGQKHNNVYVPRSRSLTLRYVDGTLTGQVVTPNMLVFDGTKVGETNYNGCARFDLHEIVNGMAFLLGGRGYLYDVPYGHFLLNRTLVDELAPQVQPSGGGRGEPAPTTDQVWRVNPQSIPGSMHYKPEAGPGQLWTNYARGYGSLLWSFLQDATGEKVAGGGQLRAMLAPDAHIRECDVPWIRAFSWDETGRHNGFVWGAYVKVTAGDRKLYGWLVVAHQLENHEVVNHVI